MNYPEHEKMSAIKEESHTIGEFLDWLRNQEIHLGIWRDYWNNGEERYVPADADGQKLDCQYMHETSKENSRKYTNSSLFAMKNPKFEEKPSGCYQEHRSAEEILAEYFQIDLKKIEAEKDAMLAKLRSQSASV